MVAVLASVWLVGEAEKAGLQRRIRQFVKLGPLPGLPAGPVSLPGRCLAEAPPSAQACTAASQLPSCTVSRAFLHDGKPLLEQGFRAASTRAVENKTRVWVPKNFHWK